MMTTAEQDPRSCADCAWYRPLSHLVKKMDGYCGHPFTYKGTGDGGEPLPLFVVDCQRACRFRVPRRTGEAWDEDE